MASSWISTTSIKTGLSPPKFEIALKERWGSVLVLGFHGTVTVMRSFDTFKSSQVVGLRTRVASIRTLNFFSPHPYEGSGEL